MNLYRPPRAAIGPRPIPASAGIALRPAHYDRVLRQRPSVAWLEVHAENHMTGSHLAADLQHIAGDYPLSLHAVGLSLGSVSGPDRSHLEKLRDLVMMLQPALVSDHLSWSEVDGIHFPDLLPLPYTDEALEVVIRNVHFIQETLRRPLLIENPSRYLSLPDSTLSEGEFLAEVVARTGCRLLLDVNNLFVTAVNSGAAAPAALNDLLSRISPEHVSEVHLAGHTVVPSACGGSLLVDHHGSNVRPEVWELFEAAITELGPVPALVEWDAHLPSFETLQAQAAAVQTILSRNIPAESHAQVD